MTLQESEERYRSLFDSIDAGFCVIEVIPEARGRPADYRFLEANAHVPAQEEHSFERYGRVARTGEPERFTGPGGWYEVHAFRIGGTGSRKIGVLFNDISARFLATLAHELRNPLAPIRNALDFLRLKGSPEPELAAARELIDRQVSHLVRLVDDLLDASRITFDKLELQRTRLDLREVAREAVSASAPQLAAAGHRLSLRLADEPVWVDGDRVRLSQVICNLLNNAARYTPAKGSLALEVRRAGGQAQIAVADTGIGIAPDQLARIFEPFVQIRRTDGAQPGGMGLGLSLAKTLVELHGGRIRAESEGASRGSRFVVDLPRAAAPAAAEVPGERATAAPRRWLVVDDNPDVTESQAALLRLLGHEVETANNGAEALRKARAFRPEIILLDLGMPGMDGFEVARRLRATPEGRATLLVAQTGWAQEEDRRRTLAAGFDAHFAKPVDVALLLRLVAT